MRKNKDERKKRKRKKKGRKEQKGKQFIERKEGKKRKKEREKEDFPAFGRSKFDGSRTKVGACSAIYVWTPRSWSFDKLHKVGYFPTWFTFSLKDIYVTPQNPGVR